MSLSSGSAKRSRTRRMGESVYGALLLVKNVSAALLAALLLCAGAWASWFDVGPAVRGNESGQVRVDRCGKHQCNGSFRPAGSGRAGTRSVTLSRPLAGDRSRPVPVALTPHGKYDVVRTDLAGVLYGAMPLGGALLLVALVVAGGLRMKRTALVAALAGAGILGGAWALLSF